MSAVLYPATLPAPSVAVTAPAERRLLSDVTGGPQQARAVQRDFLADETVEWFFTPTQAQAFDDWWRATLTYGGAWFAASWPSPQGLAVALVRRFKGAPKWQHIPGGFWRVAATLQVRGRGLAPSFTDVIFLQQRGVLVDSSTYGHPVTAVAGVTTLVDKPNFPSGKGTRIVGAANLNGVKIGNFSAGVSSPPQPEWNFGSSPVCFEMFINIATGALAGAGQTFFTNAFGAAPLNWSVVASGAPTFALDATHTAFGSPAGTPPVPYIAENVDTYFAMQIHADRSVSIFVGPVSGGVATGGVVGVGAPASLADCAYGPSIGFEGGYGGSLNYVYDQVRITKTEVYPDPATTSIAIPTQLFPED